jgi:hypothetical protein
MGFSDITCSDLVAIDDVAGIQLKWTINDPWPPTIHYSVEFAEVWAATVNNRADASFQKIGQGLTNYLHAGLQRGETRFYWVRARNKIYQSVAGVMTWVGSYGAWHPESATGGVQGTELSGDILIAPNGYWRHPSGLLHQWGLHSVAGSETIPFPIPYPTAVLNIVACIALGTAANRTASVGLSSLDEFSAWITDNTGGGHSEWIYWQAIGY